MSDAVLRVDFAGPLISVQDAGRAGYMRYGVPQSGPQDRLSFAAANAALGNAANTPAIEISLGGLRLTCLSGRVSYAVAGGGFIIDHAGVKGGSWSVATLTAGETLIIRPGHWGSWCYLSFAGQIHRPKWLNSAATHALSGFGSGKLVTGQTLTIENAECRPDHHGTIPCPIIARPRRDIRVTLGPQDRFFGSDSLGRFLTGPWYMTDAWDRMGVRLSGPSIPPSAALDMVSEPIARGSVQVAGDGVPSILLADHQTTGGYPKIATVQECDLDGLVQLRPRDGLRFITVSAGEAVCIARMAARSTKSFLTALEQRHRQP